MERTNKTEPGKILWICKGSSFRMRSGKIIKHNQRFSASVEEIPSAFRDTIIPVNPEELKKTETLTSPVPELEYSLRTKGVGWFDVVDGDGKVQNEKSLRKPEAEELLSSLKG